MNVIVACKSVRAELEKEMKAQGCNYPVIWLDADFHEQPENLNNLLQTTLDSITQAEHVLLCYGFCGNALVGLVPHGFKLIFPKAENCISLILGSDKRRKELERASYFFTHGWLNNNRSILKEYEDTIEKYGEQSADYVYEFMLDGYKNALIVDTGVEDINNAIEKTKPFTTKFKLNQEVVQGDLTLFAKLISKNWDDSFVIIEPDTAIKKEDLVFSL